MIEKLEDFRKQLDELDQKLSDPDVMKVFIFEFFFGSPILTIPKFKSYMSPSCIKISFD